MAASIVIMLFALGGVVASPATMTTKVQNSLFDDFNIHGARREAIAEDIGNVTVRISEKFPGLSLHGHIESFENVRAAKCLSLYTAIGVANASSHVMAPRVVADGRRVFDEVCGDDAFGKLDKMFRSARVGSRNMLSWVDYVTGAALAITGAGLAISGVVITAFLPQFAFISAPLAILGTGICSGGIAEIFGTLEDDGYSMLYDRPFDAINQTIARTTEIFS